MPHRAAEGLAADVRVAAAGPLHARPPVVPVLIFAPAIALLLRHRRRARRAPRPRSASRSAATPSGRSPSTGCTASSSTSSPSSGLGARLHWMIHGVHHDHPNDPLRLVMPPVGQRAAGARVLRRVLARARARRTRSAFGAGFLARLPRLRHGPLPRAPPHAAHARSGAAARAAHAPPLPGRRARLRRQRAVLGPRVRHRTTAPVALSARASIVRDAVMLSRS